MPEIVVKELKESFLSTKDSFLRFIGDKLDEFEGDLSDVIMPTFISQGQEIKNPFVDRTYRKSVNPLVYYAEDLTPEYIQKYLAYLDYLDEKGLI